MIKIHLSEPRFGIHFIVFNLLQLFNKKAAYQIDSLDSMKNELPCLYSRPTCMFLDQNGFSREQ